MMLAAHLLLMLLQSTSNSEPVDAGAEVVIAEAKDYLEELRNTPYSVAKNSAGSEWFIRVGDLDQGTHSNQLVWVTTYIHAAGKYRNDSKLRTLTRVNCENWTYRNEVTLSYYTDGRVKSRRLADGNVPMVEPIPRSPMEKVMNAFCAPELER